MTHEKKFKKQVRERMMRTGETYSVARRMLDAEPTSGEASGIVRLEETGVDQLVADLRGAVDGIWSDIKAGDRTDPANLDRLGALGAAIHTSMAIAGTEPRHRKMLVKNRRDSRPSGLPGTPVFYAHIHAAESLLRFVSDPVGANLDPEDTTLGEAFTMGVYSRRWGYRDTFHVMRTATGWSFRHVTTLATDPDGRQRGAEGTGFFEMLDREAINYPQDLPEYFQFLWTAAAEGLDRAGVESALTALADWISKCEAASPAGLFVSLK